MSRYLRNTVILAKIESGYGVDPTPTGAANALLVSNPAPPVFAYQNVNRDLVRGYFGGSEELVGLRSVELAFDIEFSGSGDAGLTAPAWAPLLRACGFSETDSGAYFTYLPISTAIPSLTLYYFLDGVLHKALGCRGTCDFKMGLGERPLMSFKFTGLDGGVTEVANDTPTLTAWKTPPVITDTNAGDINFGCTYSTGALSAGTAYPSRGLNFSLGNAVAFTPLLGGESVDLTDRDLTGSISLELTAAQTVTFKTAVDANTMSSMGFSFGTASGYSLVLYMPNVQRINPRVEDYNGRVMATYDLRITPSAGNDELTLVVK